MEKSNDSKEEKREVIAGRDFYVDFEEESQNPYGIPKEYKRSDYDNPYAHQKFKNKEFTNKQGKMNKTTLDENGKLVYRTKKDSKARYGESIGEKSVADADHIDTLKNIHERHKNNPFLTKTDIKEVANRTTESHSNFQLMKASDNRSKQADSDITEGFREGNIDKALKGVKAQVETDVLLTQKAAINVGKTFVSGASQALESSVIPLMIVGTQDLVKVAQGEMTMKEAIEDVGTVGLKIAATGGSLRVASYALSGIIEQSGNTILQTVAKTNQIGTIIVAGTIVARATSKYISGEIDGKQFFEEISEEGLSLVAGIVGSVIAGPVGTVIASMACSIMVTSIKTLKQNFQLLNEMEHQYLATLDRVSNRMIAEIKKSREQLKVTFETEKKQWNESIDKGFEAILYGAVHNNMDEVSNGLNAIMNLFGSDVQFKNSSEVRNFMDSEHRVFQL